MALNQFLILAAFLFCIGVYGVLARTQRRARADEHRAHAQRGEHQPRRVLRASTQAVAGQVFALFVITIAAAEVGVGLAIVLLIYRNRRASTSTRSTR